MRISTEVFDSVIQKLEEINEWAQENKNIDQMDFILDSSYEALIFLQEGVSKCK